VVISDDIKRYAALGQYSLDLIKKVVDQLLCILEPVGASSAVTGRFLDRDPLTLVAWALSKPTSRPPSGACRVNEYRNPWGLSLVIFTRRISNFTK
jgi:hypothetical protein